MVVVSSSSCSWVEDETGPKLSPLSEGIGGDDGGFAFGSSNQSEVGDDAADRKILFDDVDDCTCCWMEDTLLTWNENVVTSSRQTRILLLEAIMLMSCSFL